LQNKRRVKTIRARQVPRGLPPPNHTPAAPPCARAPRYWAQRRQGLAVPRSSHRRPAWRFVPYLQLTGRTQSGPTHLGSYSSLSTHSTSVSAIIETMSTFSDVLDQLRKNQPQGKYGIAFEKLMV